MKFGIKIYKLNSICHQRSLIRFASKAATSKQKTDKSTSKQKTDNAKSKKQSETSSLYEDMQQRANDVASNDYKYLSETFIKRLHQVKTKGDHDILREGKMSLWNYIMSYQNQYPEKAVLVDTQAASKIAKAILNNTHAQSIQGSQTNIRHKIFIDGNGGLCRVTDEIINECNKTGHVFSCYKIFEKDVNLVSALQRARNEYLKCDVPDNPGNVMSLMNINKQVIDWMKCKEKKNYISDIYQRVLVRYPYLPWNTEEPIYTLYMTATLGTVRYFVHQCMHRNECCSNDMSRGRPEFFFVVTPKTWTHLTLGTCYEKTPLNRYSTSLNVLFNLLFKYELIETISKKSFIPWPKKPKEKTAATHIGRQINADENMYLIKARPKTDVGIINELHFCDASMKQNSPDFPPHWLEYFVHAITVETASNRFLPILDKWHPSAALHCVRKGLVPVYMTLADFFESPRVEEKIIPVFNSLLAQKNLHLSSFVAMADEYIKGELRHEHKERVAYSDEASLDFSLPFTSLTDPNDNYEDIEE